MLRAETRLAQYQSEKEKFHLSRCTALPYPCPALPARSSGATARWKFKLQTRIDSFFRFARSPNAERRAKLSIFGAKNGKKPRSLGFRCPVIAN